MDALDGGDVWLLAIAEQGAVPDAPRHWPALTFPPTMLIKVSDHDHAVALTGADKPGVVLVGISTQDEEEVEMVRRLKLVHPNGAVFTLPALDRASHRADVLKSRTDACARTRRLRMELVLRLEEHLRPAPRTGEPVVFEGVTRRGGWQG